jgi:hypothetical protein
MGRPLKIQKYGTAQGITNGANGALNQPAAAVPVDQGYPNFGSLTDPEYNSADTLNSNQFYGVVGGAKSSALSTTFPIVKCRVYITNSYSTEADGVILRQKGSHKYMVATTASIDPANAVAGVALRITVVGDTDWAAMGLTGTAAIGTIFTPTAAAGAGTTGTAQEVGQCVLTSDLSPTAGLMSISYFTGDSTEVAISKLTNKYLLNWSTFQNAAGDSLTTYASTGNNVGPVVYSGEGQYLTNFFTDEGTATKSGSEDNSTLSIAIVENYTS